MGLLRHRMIAGHLVIHKDGLYRVWEETHLRRLLRHLQVDCVFDVGANVGQYGTMLRDQCDYKGLIISFEPNRDVLPRLIERTRKDRHWFVEELALSSEDGEQRFNVMRGSEFSSLSGPRHDDVQLFREMNVVSRVDMVHTQTLTTAMRRLQEQHGFTRPFLKLDTQGLDVEIVRHGADVIGEFVGLQSELSLRPIYDDSMDFRQAISFYEELGFLMSAIVPNNAGHFPLLVEADGILVRSDLAV